MEITCKTNDTLPLSALTEFQGGLKKRTEDDYNKIIKSINKYGFAFPLFVWQHDGINYVLDGHGRLGALQRMTSAGEKMPDLPVVYVNVKDEADAKNLLLRLNSSYGKMTEESVADFVGQIDIDFNDLQLPSGFIDFAGLETSVADFGTDFKLADGDKSEICQITFTLHERQKALIEYALEQVAGDIEETFGNTNKNGNALYEVVRQWAEQKR